MQENQFIDNDKIPKQIFKFRDFEKPYHLDTLKGQLYFSSPLDFNDPFDCNINIAYHKLQGNYNRKIEMCAILKRNVIK